MVTDEKKADKRYAAEKKRAERKSRTMNDFHTPPTVFMLGWAEGFKAALVVFAAEADCAKGE